MFEDYQFEWDPQKDEANLKKHGLSFERARTIWDDERRICYHLCDQPETLLARHRKARTTHLHVCSGDLPGGAHSAHLGKVRNQAGD